MARLARWVVPGLPQHVTQRGNRRRRTFFGDDRRVKVEVDPIQLAWMVNWIEC